MSEQIVLLTGATSGIGKATAFGLAQKSFTLILPVRNLEKGEKIKQEILAKFPQSQIHLFECDLADLQSIKIFAENVKKQFSALHVLINNAGVWKNTFTLTKDGFEQTFAVNHLAHFYLTLLLIDLLQKSAPARVINVASDLHQGDIHFTDVELRKNYNGLNAYKQSKLANILFTRILAEKLKSSQISVNALMPGFIATDIFEDLPFFLRWLIPLVAKSPEKGAETTLYLATEPNLQVTGEYFKNKQRASSSYQSKNMETAQKLWNLSVQMLEQKGFQVPKL
ncbi:SDR family oxidoreductase [Raineya orbicola]|uniref:Dehydrogenases with different specificities (Related to short-chain alcohol dehydrogenases) n=1 Tax=Raineya orbicola TaxID=2016530 RepID=A0A2N3IIP7_9BACT|nr:SDR family oxidoreductase [Raineya orbicola]PKQ70177.1 Dehydrogenases with different specificities (related to short-chain alcohol dehydrogenases) [Raineya orbicola]